MPDMSTYISHKYGWANLDQANKSHYASKRRPEWLTLAADKLRELENREIQAIDEWMDGKIEREAVIAIQLEREQAQTEYDRLYEFWNARPVNLEGNHASTIAEIPQETYIGQETGQ